MTKTKLAYDDYTIAWICALPLEMAAAKVMLEETHESLPQPQADQNSYSLGEMSGHNIVLICLPSGVYGTTSAATVLSQMLSTFPSIKVGLMVGIGGGVPSSSVDIRLGDVVVSMPSSSSGGVIQHDYGKTLPDGLFQHTGSLNSPPQVLLSAVSQMRSNHMIKGTEIHAIVMNTLESNRYMGEKFSPPGRDLLFNATYQHPKSSLDCSQCDRSQVVNRIPRKSREPQIHYGLVASGNQVIKDAKTRDSLAQKLGVLCFEMEAAGLMNQLPCLVIRGICDYCDSHKQKAWQGYSALSASAYAKVLLTVVPISSSKETDFRSQRKTGIQSVDIVPNEPSIKSRTIDVLKRLNVSKYRDQKDRNPVRIPGTCEWLVTHPIFQAWKEIQRSQMLWVSANPGCGKSVLAKYLADSVLTNHPGRTVGYFFFKDDFEDQRSIAKAICCILHRLFYHNRGLLTERIIEQFEMNERIVDSFSDLWDVLISAAKQKDAGEIICLLDAFDECEQDGWSQLTEALQRLYTDETRHEFNLKFLITSRLYGRIRHRFQPIQIPGQPLIHLSGEHDDEMKKISREINIFIEERVNAIGTQLKLTEEEQSILLKSLMRVPNTTYLWVYLTLNLIESNMDIDKIGIVTATSDLPATVEEAYERILSRSKDSGKARKLLHIVLGATRPLTLQEMNLALSLNETHRSYSDLDLRSQDRFHEYIRDICGLFITVVDGKIYLLHQTAREFLILEDKSLIQEDTSNNIFYMLRHTARRILFGDTEKGSNDNIESLAWKHSVILQESHRIIAMICIQYLLLSDFRKAWPLATDIGELTDGYIFLDYSAKSWVTHILDSKTKTDNIETSLLTLCDLIGGHHPVWFQIYWTSIHTDLPTGFTSLMIASYFGLMPVLKYWIEMGKAEIDAQDHVYGRSALSWAAGNGHTAAVKLLIKGSLKRPWVKTAEIDARDSYQRTPLSWAILNGHVDVVSQLLKAGADINLKDDIGGTPYGILNGILSPMRKGVSYDDGRLTINKTLLLIEAAREGYEAIVRFVLEITPDMNQKSQMSRIPLNWAAGNGHGAIVKLLLENNPDMELKNGFGRSSLSSAAEQGYKEIVRLLLENKADIESKDNLGKTPLFLAAERGYKEIVILLLDNKADIESKDNLGKTPLSSAAEQGHKEVVRLLLENNADTESKDYCGRTPLFWAAVWDNEDVVRLLQENNVSTE